MSVRTLRAVSRAEAALVKEGREALQGYLPCQDFDDSSWDLTERKRRHHRRGKKSVYFTERGTHVRALPPRFANVIKAIVAIQGRENEAATGLVDAARVLWAAVLERLRDRSAFTWAAVRPEDFTRAERILADVYEEDTVRKSIGYLNALLSALAVHRIVVPMAVAYTTSLSRDKSTDESSMDEARLAHMPSDLAMDKLADIYARYAVTPWDQLMSAIAALHVATALRTGEVLTLGTNCLVKERADGRVKRGIRFAKEKSQGRGRPIEIRWLDDEQAKIAVPAIRRIFRLTRLAREQARLLERDTGQMALDRAVVEGGKVRVKPAPPGHWRLGTPAIARLLGYSDVAAVHGFLNRHKVPRVMRPWGGSHPGRPRYLVSVSDLAVALQKDRERRAPASVHGVASDGVGGVQRLSESLLPVFVGASHAVKGADPFLVDLVTTQAMDLWLGGKWERLKQDRHGPGRAMREGEEPVERNGVLMVPNAKSVFMRLDGTTALDGTLISMREEDGRLIELDTHDFRHWVTTKSNLHGIETEVLMRWQNREHAGDLKHYKHLTREQQLRVLRDAIKSGRLKGDIADMYFVLKEDVRDVFLEHQLVAVHVSAVGLCVHDFASSPCRRALGCLGCPDYVHDTANPAEREQLVQLERRLVLVLDQAERQVARGEEDLAESWVETHREKLGHVRYVLSLKPPGGTTLVQPFLGQAVNRLSTAG